MNSGIIALGKIGAEAGLIALRVAILRAFFMVSSTTFIAPAVSTIVHILAFLYTNTHIKTYPRTLQDDRCLLRFSMDLFIKARNSLRSRLKRSRLSAGVSPSFSNIIIPHIQWARMLVIGSAQGRSGRGIPPPPPKNGEFSNYSAGKTTRRISPFHR